MGGKRPPKRLVRVLFDIVKRIDRADPRLLRILPSSWKRRAARSALRLLDRTAHSGNSLEINGVLLSVPRSQRSTYVLQRHEPGTCQLLEELLRPGMVVIDVGANIGFFTLLAARLVGEKGEVWAVEPSEANLTVLRSNLRLNGASNVKVLPVAAGAARGSRCFFLRKDGGHHGFYVHPRERAESAVEVATAPLDELVAGPVDLVKIDAEAAELEVLKGMKRLMNDNPDLALVVEWSQALLRASGQPRLEMPHFLERCGFQLWAIDERAAGTGGVEGLLKPFLADGLNSEVEHNLFARRSWPFGSRQPSASR